MLKLWRILSNFGENHSQVFVFARGVQCLHTIMRGENATRMPHFHRFLFISSSSGDTSADAYQNVIQRLKRRLLWFIIFQRI